MERESFIFYQSWLEGISGFTDEEQGAICLALLRYCAYGIEPQGASAVVNMAFTYAKPQIDVNNIRYENGRKGGSKKGVSNNPYGRAGKPKEETTKELPKNYQKTTKELPNVNVNVNVNDNVIKENNVKEKSQSVRFAPPSEKEVKDYMDDYIARKRAEGKYVNVSPDISRDFWDFYQSKGWKVGTASMRDWRAAARRWVNDPRSKAKVVNSTIHFEGEYDRSVYARDAELVKQLQKQ